MIEARSSIVFSFYNGSQREERGLRRGFDNSVPGITIPVCRIRSCRLSFKFEWSAVMDSYSTDMYEAMVDSWLLFYTEREETL
jgi:hypothetical protein